VLAGPHSTYCSKPMSSTCRMGGCMYSKLLLRVTPSYAVGIAGPVGRHRHCILPWWPQWSHCGIANDLPWPPSAYCWPDVIQWEDSFSISIVVLHGNGPASKAPISNQLSHLFFGLLAIYIWNVDIFVALCECSVGSAISPQKETGYVSVGSINCMVIQLNFRWLG